jgi:flagellar hook protein FlgE
MINALYTGMSGLFGNQLALNTESNNIANVNTIAFKADDVSFVDALYDNSNGVQVGMGVATPIVEKNFKQGSFRFTDSPYDMALDGPGYFMVTDTSGNEAYTRAGNFKIGGDGMFVNANDLTVKGISINTPIVDASDEADTVFTSNYNTFISSKSVVTDEKIINFNAKSSDYKLSAKDDDLATMSGNGYKNTTSKLNDIDLLRAEYNAKIGMFVRDENTETFTGLESWSSTINKANITANSAFQIEIDNNLVRQSFDTDADTTLKLFADKISEVKGIEGKVDTATGKLTINSLVPGKDILTQNLYLDSTPIKQTKDVARTVDNIDTVVSDIQTALKTSLSRAGAEFMAIRTELDLTKQTNLDFSELQMKLDSLKLTDSPFGNPEVIDGTLYIQQGDNKFLVGKVGTVGFLDEESLKAVGDNLYVKTANSGNPVATNATTDVISGALELSNSSLGTSLTALMVYQRAFEANAKSVTTADSFLNTAIQLKKA